MHGGPGQGRYSLHVLYGQYFWPTQRLCISRVQVRSEWPDGNETIGTEDIPELPDKEQLILVYCRSGNRSKQASEKLVKLGYTNIVEFGGINDWTGETVSGEA